MGPGCEVVPQWALCPCRGCGLPPASPLEARKGILVWPVTLRHLGSGARTFTGSPATWRLLSPRGWGEAHESRRDRQLYGVEVSYQPITPAPTGTGAIAGRAWGMVSAEMRCSCAVRHTLHGAIRGHQRCEHSGQRPQESGAWVASKARHPKVRRGSSPRATDSSDSLSASLTSSSSRSSRSHTAWRRI